MYLKQFFGGICAMGLGGWTLMTDSVACPLQLGGLVTNNNYSIVNDEYLKGSFDVKSTHLCSLLISQN